MQGVTVTGDRETAKNLLRLVKAVDKKLAIISMKAASPILKAARQNAQSATDKRTGLLPKSIKARKAKLKYKNRRLVVIGPTHMERLMRITKTGKLRGVSEAKVKEMKVQGERTRLVKVDPARYGHLVEWGTKHVSPRPFMRPAYEAHGGTAMAILKRESWGAILEESRKLHAKIQSIGGKHR